MIYKFPIIKQKFMRGDIVNVSDVPSYMRYFENSCEAIVVGSYSDLCQPHIRPVDGYYLSEQYSLFFPDTGSSSSWYEESQLTLIGRLPEDEIYLRTNPAKEGL